MQFQIDVASKAKLSPDDQQAMSRTLALLMRGFAERNADLLADVYSDDADWINAFGSRKRGAAEIVTYLRGLFNDANFNEGEVIAPPEVTLRILNPETAVVSAHLRIRGQRLINGELLHRDNHSIRILQRRAAADWVIVSEMYMDAHTEQSYSGHS